MKELNQIRDNHKNETRQVVLEQEFEMALLPGTRWIQETGDRRLGQENVIIEVNCGVRGVWQTHTQFVFA